MDRRFMYLYDQNDSYMRRYCKLDPRPEGGFQRPEGGFQRPEGGYQRPRRDSGFRRRSYDGNRGNNRYRQDGY